MEFLNINLNDADRLNAYFQANNYRISDYTAATLWLWKDFFDNQYAEFDGKLILKSRNNLVGYSYPFGEGDATKTLLALYEDCLARGEVLTFPNAPKEAVAELNKLFDCDATYLPDWSDYIYNVSDISTYAGKKYHGKRGHVKNFWANFNAEFVPLNALSERAVDTFFKEAEFNSDGSAMASYEMKAALNAYKYRNELRLSGGGLSVGGEIAALSIGEVIGDTLFVHIEKALRKFIGSGETMAQEFVRHCASNAIYVNREEDLGDEGLRKSKQSFRPVMMGEKYRVIVSGLKNN